MIMSSTGPTSARVSPSASVSMEEEEPRKKGSRGGKRSVTHLSKAQLDRKRANDREAQRNIRQRTKEHIETLERRVKELEQGTRSTSLERVLKRNQELEEQVEQLREQVAAQRQGPAITQRISQEIPDDLILPQKVTLNWMPASSRATGSWAGAVPPHILANHEAPDYSSSERKSSRGYSPSTTPMRYEEEASPQLFTPNATPSVTPIWDDSLVYGASQNMAKSTPAWAPFQAPFSQASRFSDPQQARYREVNGTPGPYNATAWQNQPSLYAWQISTKVKAPVTYLDQLMFSVIQSQRHLAITTDLTGDDLIGPSFPSVHILFNQPGPVSEHPSRIHEVMERYSTILINRGFSLIPEKLASFMCMYRFVQWQINPNHDTYQALHEWQAPRPSQLMIPHPGWMDLPPWGKFRDKIIENQDKYDKSEFQNDYASNLSVNFPHDPMKALIFDEGKIMVSKVMDRHLSDIGNMSMKRPFAEKYPEFADVCRFDEVAA